MAVGYQMGTRIVSYLLFYLVEMVEPQICIWEETVQNLQGTCYHDWVLLIYFSVILGKGCCSTRYNATRSL